MMNEQSRKLERPKWVGRAFVGVVVLAIMAVIVWRVTSGEKASGEPAAAARAPQETWIGYTFQTDEEYRDNTVKDIKQRSEGPCQVIFDERGNLDFFTCLYGGRRGDQYLTAVDVVGRSGTYLNNDATGRLELAFEIPAVEYRFRWIDDKDQTGEFVLRKERR